MQASTLRKSKRSEGVALRPAALLFSMAFLSFGQTTITYTQYPLPVAGSPVGITAGPDGALWFPIIKCDYGCPSGTQNDSIGRMTPDGVFTEYELPPIPYGNVHSRPTFITAGPDGALWFTESDPAWVNRIGRITTAGAITEFNIPLPNSQVYAGPTGITTGSDGALWALGMGYWVVSRLTTAGFNTQYGFPTIHRPSGLGGMAAGPDGALWFTFYSDVEQVAARITTAGIVTEFPLGFDCNPEGITAGPDGALWFACWDRIGRITTNGEVTTYAVPTSNGRPQNISVGPEGALWFTEQNANQVGRITTGGVVTEFPYPVVALGAFKTITKGPDGNLWFASSSGTDLTHPQGTIVKGVIRPEPDTTPPVIVPRVDGTLGSNGWYTSDVSVDWQVNDPESGIQSGSGCARTTLTTNTTGVNLTCSATNGAGLLNSASVTIRIDKTPPVVSGMPGAGCTLWPPNHKLLDIATVNAGDATSGLAPGSFTVVGTSNQMSDPRNPDIVIVSNGSGGFTVQLRAERLGDAESRVYTLKATAKDLAGNTASLRATCTVPHNAN